jgi:hypothetical protein
VPVACRDREKALPDARWREGIGGAKGGAQWQLQAWPLHRRDDRLSSVAKGADSRGESIDQETASALRTGRPKRPHQCGTRAAVGLNGTLYVAGGFRGTGRPALEGHSHSVCGGRVAWSVSPVRLCHLTPDIPDPQPGTANLGSVHALARFSGRSPLYVPRSDPLRPPPDRTNQTGPNADWHRTGERGEQPTREADCVYTPCHFRTSQSS